MKKQWCYNRRYINDLSSPYKQTTIHQWVPNMKSDSKSMPKKHIEQIVTQDVDYEKDEYCNRYR